VPFIGKEGEKDDAPQGGKNALRKEKASASHQGKGARRRKEVEESREGKGGMPCTGKSTASL